MGMEFIKGAQDASRFGLVANPTHQDGNRAIRSRTSYRTLPLPVISVTPDSRRSLSVP